MKIKKWNGSAWVQEYPEVNVSSIVATGTPSSSTFLRGDGTWASTFESGLTIGNSSGTTSDTIVFNTAQTYTGPYIRGGVQDLYRGYYISSYKIADAGNYADVIPGSWTEIYTGETTITAGTGTTTVTLTSGSINADDVVAIEFHTLDTEATYTTNIEFCKLGTASSLYSNVWFPSYNAGTILRFNMVRVWRSSSTELSFAYAYQGEVDSTPTTTTDALYVGKVWKINGVTGV